jgi:hypothetical protein
MRFAGIDIATETHVVAVVEETGTVLLKPSPFTEDAEGHARLLGRLGPGSDRLVVMEAQPFTADPVPAGRRTGNSA